MQSQALLQEGAWPAGYFLMALGDPSGTPRAQAGRWLGSAVGVDIEPMMALLKPGAGDLRFVDSVEEACQDGANLRCRWCNGCRHHERTITLSKAPKRGKWKAKKGPSMQKAAETFVWDQAPLKALRYHAKNTGCVVKSLLRALVGPHQGAQAILTQLLAQWEGYTKLTHAQWWDCNFADAESDKPRGATEYWRTGDIHWRTPAVNTRGTKTGCTFEPYSCPKYGQGGFKEWPGRTLISNQ